VLLHVGGIVLLVIKNRGAISFANAGTCAFWVSLVITLSLYLYTAFKDPGYVRTPLFRAETELEEKSKFPHQRPPSSTLQQQKEFDILIDQSPSRKVSQSSNRYLPSDKIHAEKKEFKKMDIHQNSLTRSPPIVVGSRHNTPQNRFGSQILQEDVYGIEHTLRDTSFCFQNPMFKSEEENIDIDVQNGLVLNDISFTLNENNYVTAPALANVKTPEHKTFDRRVHNKKSKSDVKKKSNIGIAHDNLKSYTEMYHEKDSFSSIISKGRCSLLIEGEKSKAFKNLKIKFSGNITDILDMPQIDLSSAIQEFEIAASNIPQLTGDNEGQKSIKDFSPKLKMPLNTSGAITTNDTPINDRTNPEEEKELKKLTDVSCQNSQINEIKLSNYRISEESEGASQDEQYRQKTPRHNLDEYVEESGSECQKNDQNSVIAVEYRFCRLCYLEQPLRSKHCRVCKCCVATYDHHCPWLGTCVGEKNRRAFYFYLIFQGIFLSVACSIASNGYSNESVTSDWMRDNWYLILVHMVIVVFLLMVLSLIFFHTLLSLKNMTTWEFLSWKKISYLQSWPRRLGSPFSIGLFSNLKLYFLYDLPRKDFYIWKMPHRIPKLA